MKDGESLYYKNVNSQGKGLDLNLEYAGHFRVPIIQKSQCIVDDYELQKIIPSIAQTACGFLFSALKLDLDIAARMA